MAKRIIWSQQARSERHEILHYWFIRTGNKKYSKKLASQFSETVKYIASQNYLGRQTELVDVRVTVCGVYLLFYQLNNDSVEIISIFDNRRNPQDLNI
jgi:plasmid stabilization system protein ParE